MHRSSEQVEVCKSLASNGDSEAAMLLGNAYSHKWPTLGGVRSDPREALYWYAIATDRGHLPAMRELFDAYSLGTLAPKNDRKAEEYLSRAAGAGAQWAQLVLAFRLEKTEPDKAFTFYLNVALLDNCHAQARVAKAYFDGDLTARNLTRAYFWLLLAQVRLRMSEFHPMAKGRGDFHASNFNSEGCYYSLPFKDSLERALPRDAIHLVEDAASSWQPGQPEPSFLGPGIAGPTSSEPPPIAVVEPHTTPRVSVPPAVVAAPTQTAQRWTPLARVGWHPPLTNPLGAVRPFEVASQSVWLVLAAPSAEEKREKIQAGLGSAIAVTSTLLLTNCHVIESRSLIWIKKGDRVERARIVSGDFQSDRCIITVEAGGLVPVLGMRMYSDLKVGEEVYSIGSPSGLETTLGQGVISGLRRLEQLRLLQTSAPLSPGSSGGGLFDKSGNLIGVTSFRLREGQNLNFAIAVEDYFQ
jgi:S1-C subfamily serine protease